MSSISMPIIWAVLVVVFAIIEGVTLGLTSIWFAAGALVALLVSLVNLPIYVQVLVFALVSIIMLVYTRPIAQRKLKVGSEKTNVDSMIGESGVVIKSIEEFHTGQVKVKGQIWTAISEGGQFIEEGEEVYVVLVEGVKLIVKKTKN